MAKVEWASLATMAVEAQVRSLLTGLRDAIVAVGWAQTADTGQLDPTTATVPASGADAGYWVFRLNDGIGSGLYLRLDPGRMGSGGMMRLGVTLGTGSDGAGEITGVILPRLDLNAASTASTTTAVSSFASSDGHSLAIMHAPENPNCRIQIIIERSRDSSGAATADAIAIALSSFGTSGVRVVPFSDPTRLSLGSHLPVALPDTIGGISAWGPTTSLSPDGEVAPTFPVPWVAAGCPPWISGACAVVAPGDAAVTSLIQVSPHGSPRTFRAFPVAGGNRLVRSNSNAAVTSSSTSTCDAAIYWED